MAELTFERCYKIRYGMYTLEPTLSMIYQRNIHFAAYNDLGHLEGGRFIFEQLNNLATVCIWKIKMNL